MISFGTVNTLFNMLSLEVQTATSAKNGNA